MGHAKFDLGSLSPFVAQKAPVSNEKAIQAQWPLCQGRAVLGGRDRVLRRWHAPGNGHGQQKAVCRHRRVHHPPAGQGLLQPPNRGIWRPGGSMERYSGLSGWYLRRGDRQGEHHLRRRGKLGRSLSGGRRRHHLRGRNGKQQQNHHRQGDRGGLPAVLRELLHPGERPSPDCFPRHARSGLFLRKRKPALGLQGRHGICLQAGRPLQLERL